MSEMSSPLSIKVKKAKLVMVGDTSVGKSSICVRFAKGSFTEYNESPLYLRMDPKVRTDAKALPITVYRVWSYIIVASYLRKFALSIMMLL